MESIILEIFRDIAFTKEKSHVLCTKLKKTRLKKKEFLLKPDQKVNDTYYIHSGCLRTYFIDPLGKEHTLQFAIKGWWISDYIALFGREKTPSVSYIECINEAVLFKVSKKDFDNLCDEIPKVSRFHIKTTVSLRVLLRIKHVYSIFRLNRLRIVIRSILLNHFFQSLNIFRLLGLEGIAKYFHYCKHSPHW